MLKQLFGLTAVMAMGLNFAFAPAALAYEKPQMHCKSEVVVRTGRSWKIKALARKAARDAWRQKVVNTKELGVKWSAWYNAEKADKPYTCFEENNKWRCTARAKPCKSLVVWHAPGRVCSPYQYNGTSEPQKYKLWAQHKARKVWVERVKMLVGDKFDTWLLSHSKNNECVKKKDGWVCTAMAKPCRLSLSLNGKDDNALVKE